MERKKCAQGTVFTDIWNILKGRYLPLHILGTLEVDYCLMVKQTVITVYPRIPPYTFVYLPYTCRKPSVYCPYTGQIPRIHFVYLPYTPYTFRIPAVYSVYISYTSRIPPYTPVYFRIPSVYFPYTSLYSVMFSKLLGLKVSTSLHLTYLDWKCLGLLQFF